MLLRISLIVAILAGIGAVVLTQIKVKPHIEGIIAARNDFEDKMKKQTARANTLDKDLKNTKGQLADTEKKLTDTEQQRAAAESKASAAETAANALKTQLAATQAAKTESDTKLSEWGALGVTPQQVQANAKEVGQLRDANKTLITEHNVFLSKIKVLQEELDSVKGEKVTDPVLPAGLKGRILVVDPKWDFVIAELNKTESEGVQKNGVLLVSRNGKLVAKVRIASTQNNRCIANVMPGWKLDELMEGDLVIY